MGFAENMLLVLSLNGFLASALIIMFRKHRRAAELLTILSSAISLAASSFLMLSNSPPLELKLIPHVTLLADRLSIFFSFVVSLVGTAVALYSV